MTKDEYIENKVADAVAKEPNMPAHNRSVLRDMLKREDEFWERQDVREDSNNSPVEGIREY